VLAFLDGRHGHLYKLTEPVQVWLSEFCTTKPQTPSSQLQRDLQSRFGVVFSVSLINQIRAKLGVSNPWRGRVQVPVKKLNDGQPVWQEGVGSLLLLAAAQQTGLLKENLFSLFFAYKIV